uniref:Uncharacterized protein n=1 Tax=Physcomitrium patens TaxID=3218 RepID=A0A2K1KF33_PHYPA|nr:hypothetical protein PHYPA_008768 [Physcomitrium patens]PNR52395.1 hypothetical protein PHYPA_008769 [Physcomitrium patens]
MGLGIETTTLRWGLLFLGSTLPSFLYLILAADQCDPTHLVYPNQWNQMCSAVVHERGQNLNGMES